MKPNILIALALLVGLTGEAKTTSIVSFERPIELIVPYAAGGPSDLLARRTAQVFTDNNINVVIRNIPGGSSNIGFAYFVNNCEVTQCLLLAGDNIADNKIYQPTGYPQDILLLANLMFSYGRTPNVVVTSPNGPSTFRSLIIYSRNNPVFFGHGGIGTSSWHAMQRLCEDMIKNCVPVAYRSGSAAIPDLIAGRLTVYAPVAFGLEAFTGNGLQHIAAMENEHNRVVEHIPLIKYNLYSYSNWNLYHRNISTTLANRMWYLLSEHFTSDELKKLGLTRN